MAPTSRGAASSASKFKYRERDPDTVKKRAEQDSGAFDSIFKSGIDTWRAKVGDNLIRFIPPTWDDPDHYGHDVWTHNYIGADSGAYLCPKKMLNKHCPICQAQKEAADAGDTEEAKALKATKKVAAWIIDRDDDNPTPQVYLMSWTMDRDISALCHNKRTGKVLMIDNPDTGYDVTIKRVGAGLKTRYFGMAIDRDPTPMMDTQKEINAIMEYVEDNPIPSTLLYKPVEYLESVVDGTAVKKDPDEEKPARRRRGGEDDDPPAEEERPARRRAAADEGDTEDRPSTRRRAADPDDDDPPARRRPAADPDDEPAPRRRAAAADPDDDDPLTTRRRRPAADDADPDDPPPRRRRPAADPDEGDTEDRPSARRRPDPDDAPPEEEERPARRRAAAADPDDDPPPRRRPAADPDDDPPPRRRRQAEPAEEDDPPPRRRREEEEEAPRRRRRDLEDDDPPAEEERRPIKRTRV